MIKNIPLVILGITIGFGAGYISRGGASSHPKDTSPVVVEAPPRTHDEKSSEAPISAPAHGHTPPPKPPAPSIPTVEAKGPASETGAALALLGEASSHREVVNALETLLPRLKAGNMQEMAASALRMPEGAERDMALMLSLGELAESNPSEALRFAESLPAGEERDQALRWIATGLPAGNVERTLGLADSVGDPDLRELIVAKVIAKEAESDPASAMNALELIEDPAIRANALAATAESWASTDPAGALSHAKDSPDPLVRSDLLLALSATPDSDSSQVFEAVLEHMPSGMAYQAAISDLFEHWAEKDPSAAALALTQIPPGPALDSATAEVASAMAESEAPKSDVAAWIGGLPAGSARNEALDGFYSAWGDTDPAGALVEASRLTGADRGVALAGIVGAWAGNDPASVIEWGISGANGFEEVRVMAVQSGIRGIARVDPDEAVRQISAVPPSMEASAASALVEVWSEVDAEAAADWLSARPRGPANDGAAGRLALSLAKEDPEMAMEWALSITAPDSKAQAVREVAKQWNMRDPEAARAFAGKLSDKTLGSFFTE